jgi:peptide deformylase
LLREVVLYGQPVLREKAHPVEKVDGAIRQLVKDMLETMYASNGAGLAAQQIGRTEAVCVIDVTSKEDARPVDKAPGPAEPPMPLVMINPRIVEMTGQQQVSEGCLSFPDIFVTLKRAAEVAVEFTTLDKKSHTVRGSGLLARAIQHELDHLNGILLVDRMSAVQKVAMAGKLKRLRRKAAEPAA